MMWLLLSVVTVLSSASSGAKCPYGAPANCAKIDFCDDCGNCPLAPCYCAECEQGFTKHSSGCGTVADSCVPALSAKTLGMYVLVADDTDKVYTSHKQWKPLLQPYQVAGADMLFLNFLNPALMPSVPPAMATLAKSKGTGAPGAVPSNTTVMFAIGGQAYSEKPNPWEWLTSTAKAEAMAVEVAKWPSLYGCDGIDLDIETGAGAAKGAGAALVAFVAKLKSLAPAMVITPPGNPLHTSLGHPLHTSLDHPLHTSLGHPLHTPLDQPLHTSPDHVAPSPPHSRDGACQVVTQPVFGSPSSVPAANRMLEAAYNKSLGSAAYGSVDKVGIMIYSGVGAETYLDNYEKGCSEHCSQWYCPLAACVPAANMVLGAGGGSDAATIAKLAADVNAKGLGGLMVWYASLIDEATGAPALQYGSDGDASRDRLGAWAEALQAMRRNVSAAAL